MSVLLSLAVYLVLIKATALLGSARLSWPFTAIYAVLVLAMQTLARAYSAVPDASPAVAYYTIGALLSTLVGTSFLASRARGADDKPLGLLRAFALAVVTYLLTEACAAAMASWLASPSDPG